MKNCFKEDMSAVDYHAHEGLGSSCLKYAQKSMAHFKAYINGNVKFKNQSALDIGKAAHAAILEQDYGQYIQGPDVRRGTKAWHEFADKHPGKVILKPDEYGYIRDMFNSFYNHPKAPKIVSEGKSELSFFASDENRGLFYKARPDYYVQSGNGDFIVDYKTSDSASLHSFSSKIYNLGYDLQAAHYMEVVEQVTERPVQDYMWIVQEKEAPFAIRIYLADHALIERAKQRRSRLLDMIGEGFKTDEYPSYTEEILPIDIPNWAINKEGYDD